MLSDVSKVVLRTYLAVASHLLPNIAKPQSPGLLLKIVVYKIKSLSLGQELCEKAIDLT